MRIALVHWRVEAQYAEQRGWRLGVIDALSPLGNDQLCYSKEGAGWKISGFVGGWVDRIISWFVDFNLSLPYLLFAFQQFGDAEIKQLHLSVVSHQHVRGLEVSMYDQVRVGVPYRA